MQKRTFNLLIGPILFVVCCLCLPITVFDTLASRAAVGTVVWLAYWWVTRPIDLAVTAFIPIAVNALIEITSMSSVIANYFSETIILLFGSSILSVSMEITGLDKRMAARFLGAIGEKLRLQLVFWFLLAVFLSAVLPNAVVCATITPVAVSMLRYAGEGEIQTSRIGSKLLLYIAYGVGIGGLFSPLGGAMNLVTVDYLQQVTGQEFMYPVWVVRFLPIMIVLIVSISLFMLRDIKRTDTLSGSKEYFKEEYQKMGPMSKEEKCSLALFLIAAVLSFTRSFYQNILPGLKPAYVFLICATFSFLIKDNNQKQVMKWKIVQGKIVWELIFVFAGGLAAGSLINGSGAAKALGAAVGEAGLSGNFFTVFIIVVLTSLMSEVTSNTATASVALPIVISIVNGLDMNPVPWIYIATIGVNLAFMMPTSIRAIPVGYGLEPKYMLKEGWKASLITMLLMSVTAYLLLRFWPAFSTIS